jgi:hypothetical protein
MVAPSEADATGGTTDEAPPIEAVGADVALPDEGVGVRSFDWDPHAALAQISEPMITS